MNGNERKKQMKSRVISYAVGLSRHRKLGTTHGLQLITARINHSGARGTHSTHSTQQQPVSSCSLHPRRGSGSHIASHNHIQSTICLTENNNLALKYEARELLVAESLLKTRHYAMTVLQHACDHVTRCPVWWQRLVTGGWSLSRCEARSPWGPIPPHS